MFLKGIAQNFDKSSEHDLKKFPKFYEACDICNPVTTV